MSILCSNKLSSIPNMINFANKQLTYFIKQGMVLFGRRFAIYNVHSLSHFKDNIIYQGPLDINSFFKYENYMQYLKHMVRNGKNPLTQIINRIDENIRHNILYINDRISKDEIHTEFPYNFYEYQQSFCQVLNYNESQKLYK